MIQEGFRNPAEMGSKCSEFGSCVISCCLICSFWCQKELQDRPITRVTLRKSLLFIALPDVLAGELYRILLH